IVTQSTGCDYKRANTLGRFLFEKCPAAEASRLRMRTLMFGGFICALVAPLFFDINVHAIPSAHLRSDDMVLVIPNDDETMSGLRRFTSQRLQPMIDSPFKRADGLMGLTMSNDIGRFLQYLSPRNPARRSI
ncbi:hypothetical protein Tcan_07335, partial [Toxocara canis]